MKHKHYDIMVAWAADTTQVVEYRHASGWYSTSEPLWDEAKEYRFKAKPAAQLLTDEQIINAMHEDGCERIENFYLVGPVQKAAVFSFAHAIALVVIGAKK